MAILTLPRRYSSQKPALGARIDYGHPLAAGMVGCWLLNEGGGAARSLVHAGDALAIVGTGAWSVGAWGPEMISGGDSGGFNLASPSSLLKPTMATLFILGTWNGGGTNSNSPRIAGMEHNSTDSVPYHAYAIGRSQNVSSTALSFSYNSAGTNVTIDSATGLLVAGQPFSAALAIGSGDTRAYHNAVEVANSATAAGIQYGASAMFDVARHPAAARDPDVDVAAILVWNRQLSRAEIQWLHAEPFAFAVAETPRMFWAALPPPPPPPPPSSPPASRWLSTGAPEPLSDVIIAKRGGGDPKRVRAGAIRRNVEVSRAGLLTADLPIADLRDIGLPLTLVGYWIEHTHPTAGIWAGVITLSDPSSDGFVRVTAETWHTLTKKRFTTPVRTKRRQRPPSGTAGALFRRAFSDISGRYTTFLTLGEVEESGPPMQMDWDRADFYDEIAPMLTDEAGFEWDVSADRVIRFATRIGQDKTGSVRLSEGLHIARFQGPTLDLALIENLLVGRGFYRARYRGHSKRFNPVIEAINQASIDKYGLMEGERDFGQVRNVDALDALIRAELARTAEPAPSVRLTLAPVGTEWSTFGLGDTVRVSLDSVGTEVDFRIMVLAINMDVGEMELAGTAEVV